MAAVPSVPRARRGVFDHEHADFRETVRAFLERECLPAQPAWRAAGGVPREVLRSAAELGFLGMAVPEEHGGLGLDDPRFAYVLAEEAMALGLTGLALTAGAQAAVVAPALTRAGARGTLLAGVADGSYVVAVADATQVALSRDGDGVRLDSRLDAVAGGVDADAFLLVGAHLPGLVLLDAAAAQVAPSPPGVGMADGGLADVVLADVPLPADALLSDEPAQVEAAVLDRLMVAACGCVAGAGAALGLTAEYVRDRRAFGRPIASFQNTVQALGDVAVVVGAAQAFVDTAIADRIAGDLTLATAAAVKAHAADVLGRATDAGLQLHGGYGYMMEYPISHAYADARFLRWHGGHTEDLRALAAAPLGLG